VGAPPDVNGSSSTTASEPEGEWHLPRVPPRAAAGEVHLWRVRLDDWAGRFAEFWRTLSDDERARADRFHFSLHRVRFVVGRGALRAILASYLADDAARLQFRYGPQGKPRLVPTADDALRFNVSHSDGLALYAVCRDRELGVDVERIRPGLELAAIAERFFSPGEAAVLRALPQALLTTAFFNGWTRKEAYLKAKGDGLSLPLDQFDVSLAPGEPPALLSSALEADAPWDSHIYAPDPGPGYAAALAFEGPALRLRCWRWSA
jgi:4'-phosphopantetheinyl transferase